MSRFRFPVILTLAAEADPADAGYVVTFPDLPEAITQGDDEADALKHAQDCLDEVLAGRLRHGEDIPLPGTGAFLVEPSIMISAKAALYLAMKGSGLSKLALARRLGWDEKEVRRLLDPAAATKITRIEQALSCLGKRLSIDVMDAA